jgi:hypothetical protein
VQITAAGIALEQVVVETGAAPDQTELPCSNMCRTASDYDWAGLQDVLARTRAETNGTGGVTIVVSDNLSYGILVNAMDACRERVHADGTAERLYPHPTLAAEG